MGHHLPRRWEQTLRGGLLSTSPAFDRGRQTVAQGGPEDHLRRSTNAAWRGQRALGAPGNSPRPQGITLQRARQSAYEAYVRLPRYFPLPAVASRSGESDGVLQVLPAEASPPAEGASPAGGWAPDYSPRPIAPRRSWKAPSSFLCPWDGGGGHLSCPPAATSSTARIP
jgi:hypothetical protein